jgi:uncharacterized protein with GYD domain
MATFITLINDTDLAKKSFKDSVSRIKQFTAKAEKLGIKVKCIYGSMGKYDGVAVLEAKNAETISALMLSSGTFRSETFQAFSTDELTKIIKKM